jgi:glycosyltransferase involved in cell wall biosynthesis
VRRLAESALWRYSIWLVNRFDHVVFSTETQSKAFTEHGLRVPVTIISNGLDTTRYRPSDGIRKDLDAKYLLPSGKRILFVSRLARDKDIEVLIRAMSRVRADAEASLLLVGRGDDRPRLESLTEELGLQHWVRFLGFVPEEDLPELYRQSDVFAIASRCEVQSIPTLQAAATGLPIVAAHAGALPELVHDGSNGFLAPPNDPEAMGEALLKVLRDPDRAHHMGEASLTIGTKHADSATFDAYEEFYHRIASS